MRLTVRYRKRYDYTTSSYGSDSSRVEEVGGGDIEWDGESDLATLIREKEHEFLQAAHPKTTPYSWGHCRHRIEVIGLVIGGFGGLAFTPANKIVLFAKAEADAAMAS